jgi:hypothetical protein
MRRKANKVWVNTQNMNEKLAEAIAYFLGTGCTIIYCNGTLFPEIAKANEQPTLDE